MGSVPVGYGECGGGVEREGLKLRVHLMSYTFVLQPGWRLGTVIGFVRFCLTRVERRPTNVARRAPQASEARLRPSA
jgi:hypothetical protein